MTRINRYLSLIKFSHTIFAMPFALVGFALGIAALQSGGVSIIPGWHTPVLPPHAKPAFSHDSLGMKLFLSDESPVLLIARYLLLVVACMVFARSAAMSFNRYLDREFDARNPRTATREIPAGMISPQKALVFTILNALLFIIACFFINRLCFYLAPVALAVVLGYSYTKRFTVLCHFILGLGLSLAPIGAYIAVTGQFALLPLIFSGIVLCWVSGFDMIYALQDVAFDRAQNLRSIPAWLGEGRALAVSRMVHVLSLAGVIFAGISGAFHAVYWIGAAIFAALLVYQQSIVRPNDLRRVNLAFMTANGIASVIFAIFVIISLFIPS
jgi:4-hydroxybenzoate polyprenyltransferase